MNGTTMDGKRYALGLAVSTIIAFGAGWLGGRLSSVPTTSPALLVDALPAPQSSASHSDTDHALSDLIVEVRGLRADLRTGREPDHTREPAATGSKDERTELLAAIKELTTALHEQPVRGERAGSGLGVRSAPAAVGFPSLDELFKAKTSNHDVSRLHRFWTLQDLIDRYGEPGFLQPDPQQGVLYASYLKPGDNNASCRFALYDGQVIYVQM
jgi:hypothetical protein